MASDYRTPTYIYKIVPASSPPPEPLPDALPVSELDHNDGFIHLSTSLQVSRTLGRYFSNVDSVYILRIQYKNVEKDIRWEDPKGKNPSGIGEENSFPHLYNGFHLGKKEVNSVQQWSNGTEGWETAIRRAEADGWFKY
ncbi:hypothetical protein CPB83DRAFT_843794 [Crepidotus variabilis]|uniref:DUF952 domain protein n=1 Tax=Crepidotus variabilis TaxID=179855 RepID=A0A9P6ESE0_9AGAR|nr:hypothetical protein CPB83DRAFT_843794 [Crepidotus variabilis]